MDWSEAETASSIPQRFDQQALRDPDKTAITGGPHRLSYRELQRLSHRYAHKLPSRDGRADELGTRAAVLLDHGAPVIAAALAALRSGFTVVALNPSDPPARHAQIRAAVQPAVLLTDEAHLGRSRAAGFGDAETVIVPATSDDGTPDPAGRWPAPDELAFLISTSGSTGRPKVVMQTHRNMLHNVLRYTNSLGIVPDDRIAWLASLSGGQGLATAWTALLNGATLCPFPIADQGMSGLSSWMVKNGVTVFDTVPSILRNFSHTLGDQRIPGIRILRLAAEAGLRTEFEAFRRHFPRDCVLASVLASSETGILSNAILRHDDELPAGNLSVGAEAEGIGVRLLDADGRDVPAGETGEIVVMSQYLSPGYWRNEPLTAERFQVEDSLRQFRTGDLARRSDSGALTVVGRIDSQVKVRGHRLQLEEVEGVLAAQPGVTGAAVAARVTPRGDATLTSYLMAEKGCALDAARLRRSLHDVLPPYAIPASFVQVDALPLTPNGKVDRDRLAELDSTVSRSAPAPGNQPEDDIERALRVIWEELLEGRPIAVTDDFFSIGGDSLLAMEMLVAIEERLSCSLTPRALLEAKTIEGLAGVIRESRSSGMLGQQIGTSSDRPRLFLAYPLDGTGLKYRWLAEALGDEFPLHMLEAPWWDGRSSELRTIEQLAAHHVAELLELQPSGPYMLAGSSFGGLLALEIARQLAACGHEIALLVALDTYAGLRDSGHPRNWPRRPPTFLGHSIPERPWMLLRIVRFRARMIRRTTAHVRWRMLLWLDQRRFGAIPERHRATYVSDRTATAGAAYRPLPYDGRVVLFRCTSYHWPEADRGWRALARGGLEIHDVACRHGEELTPPFVQHFAPRLAKVIRDTSSASGQSSDSIPVAGR